MEQEHKRIIYDLLHDLRNVFDTGTPMCTTEGKLAFIPKIIDNHRHL